MAQTRRNSWRAVDNPAEVWIASPSGQSMKFGTDKTWVQRFIQEAMTHGVVQMLC
jgi:hypothetical protein